MKPTKNVVIIILNWNRWQDTIECLESVYQIEYTNFSVIVVDNNSQDPSLQKIRDYCSGKLKVESDFFEYNAENKPLKMEEYAEGETPLEINSTDLILIKNKDNYGFPGGNNVGIRFALQNLDPDYILLLNNDTIADRSFLKELIYSGESNRNVGILGPKIYYYDKPEVIWSAGCYISWKSARGIQIGSDELDQGQYNKEKEVEYVNGSAFLIKTGVINKIGLMDETYFLYFEESDWTLRANKDGFKSLYVPEAKIWHKVSRSGGGISKPIGLYYITRNRWIFMQKWAKKGDYWYFVIYQIICSIILPISLSIYFRNCGLFKAYYKGLFDALCKSIKTQAFQ